MTTIHPDLKVVQAAKKLPVEIIAEHLVIISESMQKLRAGHLTDEAIFLLIREAAPRKGNRRNSKQITIQEIKTVIEGMEAVAGKFTKKPETAKKK